MTNWRLLEAEIMDILKTQVHRIVESGATGDKYLIVTGLGYINVTTFAKELSARIELKTRAVSAKTEPAARENAP